MQPIPDDPSQVGAIPTHYHCPDDCSHPQPFELDGILYCGRCHFVVGQTTQMVACTPATCPDDIPFEDADGFNGEYLGHCEICQMSLPCNCKDPAETTQAGEQ